MSAIRLWGGSPRDSWHLKPKQGESFAHMTGQVSTENNGGFIQFRTSIAKGTTATVSWRGTLKVRGNSQQYYIHLRSSGTLLPWQYYQGSFQVTDQWQTIKLPLSAFVPSGKWLRKSDKTQLDPQYWCGGLWSGSQRRYSNLRDRFLLSSRSRH